MNSRFRSTAFAVFALLAVACRTTAAAPPTKWQVELGGGKASVNYADASGATTSRGVYTLEACAPTEVGGLLCSNKDGWVTSIDASGSTGRLNGPSTMGPISLKCAGGKEAAVCNETSGPTPVP